MRVWRKSKSLTFLSASVIILEFLQCFALAGPVKRSSRLIREVYPEIEQEKLEGNQAEVCIVGDVVYGAEEPVPADQPCLKCKCEPPGVQCETTRCIKKPGCRAIHKPNECCPEYQCECEYEGRIYANGQRLETPPGGECRVCYCRGGEVQCAEVSCYIRTDCEGRRVPGQCCPKYDHCPPRDSLIDRIVPFTTQSPLTSYANSVDYWTTSNASVKDPLTTSLYNVQEINESNNQITETLTQPTQIQQTIDDLNKIHIHEVKLVDGGSQTDPLDDETAKQIFINGQAAHRNKTAEVREEPRITIQEIIPEIKEIPITGPPKREINLKIHSQQLDDSIELKSLNKVDPTENKDLDLGDAESDSSEISEIYHHPPPVLKIGDQLLFLKKGELVPSADVSTPLPVITIIGAEGLQRGTEDSAESHDVNSQVQEPQTVILNSLQENETESTSVFPSSNIISLLKTKLTIDTTTPSVLSTIEDFPINITDLESEISDSPLSNEKLNDTVATEDTINKTNAENTTTATEELNLQVLAADVNETDLDVSTVGALSEDNSVSDPTENLGTDDSASAYSETITIYERLQSSSSSTPVEEELFNVTESSSFESTPKYESVSEVAKLRQEEEVLIDQNPEYPPIPDIMSPQHVFEMPEHLDTEVMPTNSDNLLINTSSTVANEVETTTPNFIQLNETVTTSHPLINGRAALPPALLDISAPSDHLSDSLTEESQEIQSIILNHDGNITINTTDFLTEVTPTEVDRSKETMEESVSVESDEMVTEANKQASVMLSVEDASVETTHKLDTTDLVENITGLQRNVKEIDHNVTLFSTVTPVLRDDVELIDPKVSITDLKTKENSTITKDNRKTWLNENDNEAEDIFSQLNKELKSTPAHIKHKAGDADSEAEAIFRELLEEATSSTLSPDNNSKNEKSTSNDKESVLLQRVSEAISKFQGKESKESLDTSILGILKDFFSSQYKYYTTKK